MNRSETSGAPANQTAQSRNPYFGSVDYGPHVLGRLLRELPSNEVPSTSNSQLQVEAAAQHAENGVRTLTLGFKSIGALMMFTGMSEEEYEPGDLMNLGELLSYMSVELKFLQELREEMQGRMRDFKKPAGRAPQ